MKLQEVVDDGVSSRTEYGETACHVICACKNPKKSGQILKILKYLVESGNDSFRPNSST